MAGADGEVLPALQFLTVARGGLNPVEAWVDSATKRRYEWV